MKAIELLGVILFFMAIIGICCGFVYANTSEWDYEFSLVLAWPWLTSALYLFTSSLLCFTVNGIANNLSMILENSEEMLKIATEQKEKELEKGDWSKPSDDQNVPRKKDEPDSQYWPRVSRL